MAQILERHADFDRESQNSNIHDEGKGIETTKTRLVS